MKIRINSEVPCNSHLGSGSSAFSAFTGAVLKCLEEDFDKDYIADCTFYGDVSIVGGPSRIDDNAVTYGGIIKLTKFTPYERRLEKIDLENKVFIAVGNTGIISDTGVVVNEVEERIIKKPELMKELDKVNDICDEGLNHLKNNNLKGIGECMNRNYEVLKNIGVSITEIDDMVKIALENGAYGAKPTGACKGGCVIAVSDYPERIAKVWKENNYKAFVTKLGCEGASVEKD